MSFCASSTKANVSFGDSFQPGGVHLPCQHIVRHEGRKYTGDPASRSIHTPDPSAIGCPTQQVPTAHSLSAGFFILRRVGKFELTGSINGVKSVGSGEPSSESSILGTLVMRHMLEPSSGKLSKAYSRSGAGMRPTRISSRIIGKPPSSSPALCKTSSLIRKLAAGTTGEFVMSITLSLRTLGTMSAKSDVKMGLCLLFRNG